MVSKELYSTKDVAETRAKLLQEQQGLDKLTGLPIPAGQAVLDHSHQTQYVRGVLHRQTNVLIGKIENAYARYIKFWYNGTLPEFLRQCADYLERPEDKRYVHPAWIKRVTIDFCKLNVKGQTAVLHTLGTTQGKNAAERKRLFDKAIKTKEFTYDYIKGLIHENNCSR